MRPDKIEKEDKHRNHIVGTFERAKSLFGSVPGFELMIKAFDKIVTDIIFETGNLNMLGF